jgi:acyl-CoA dehydrogenase
VILMSGNIDAAASGLVDGVGRVCAGFGDDYWRGCDRDGAFPHAFHRAMADAGWLGITMPEAYGGAGLGVTQAALMMKRVAACGGFSAASAIHINLFGPHPIVVHGNDEQRARMLPPLVRGEHKACFAVTEPDAGLDTTRIKTAAKRTNAGYVIDGQKIWTTTAQHASHIMVLARTTPYEECAKKTQGLSLFYTAFDRDRIEAREIPKMGRSAVDSNQLFIDGLEVPAEDRIGEEGEGFRYLLDSLNPERILIGIEAVGMAQNAIARAAKYAGERQVFGRPIGQNQSIQHPLAESWMELKAAELMALEAAANMTRASRAVWKPMLQSIWVQRPRSRLAPMRSRPTAAWDMPRNFTSSGCCAK